MPRLLYVYYMTRFVYLKVHFWEIRNVGILSDLCTFSIYKNLRKEMNISENTMNLTFLIIFLRSRGSNCEWKLWGAGKWMGKEYEQFCKLNGVKTMSLSTKVHSWIRGLVWKTTRTAQFL